jgi:hypothetical protein
LLAILALVLGQVASANAHAEDPPSASGTPASDAVKRADAFFRSANQFYSEKKWTEAEADFLAAWTLNPTYDVAANLGHTQYRLGKYRDAAEHLAFALRTWPLIGKPEPRTLAQERLAEVRKLVGVLKVTTDVPGAEVVLDGRVVGRSPLLNELFVDSGIHAVEARLAGYEVARTSADVAKGIFKDVTLALVKKSAPPPPPPPPSASSSAGTINPPPAPGGPSKPIVIAGGAGAGAALVAGVVFAVISNGKAGDAATNHQELVKAGGSRVCAGQAGTDCLTLQGLWKDKDTFASASLWSFVGAGALGVGTLVYALAAPRAAATTGVRVAPIVSAQGGGLMLGAEW